MKQLVSADKLIDKKHKDAVKIMNAHFNSKPLIATERCNFHQVKQETSETMAKFAAQLKKLSLNCEFTDYKIALYDKLVYGIRNKEVRIKLFEESDLDYDKALKIFIKHEAAVKNATASMSTLKHKQYKLDIHFIRQDKHRKQHSRKYKNQRNYNEKNTQS